MLKFSVLTLKKIMVTMIILTSLMAISMNNWINMWILMEVASFLFIALINKSMSQKMYNQKSSAESMMMYFYISFISSILLIMPLSMNQALNTMSESMSNNMSSMAVMALLIKMGASPFHNWVFQIVESCNSKIMVTLLTVQKIIPVYLMSMMANWMALWSSIISSGVSMLMTMKSMKVSNMMATSSLNSTSWLLVISMVNSKLMMLFFMMYSAMITSMIPNLNKMKEFSLNMKSKEKSLMIQMFSLIGIPPMLGFIPKMMAISELNSNGMTMIMITLIISTTAMAGMYFSAMSYQTLSNTKLYKSTKSENSVNSQVMIHIMMPIVMLSTTSI